MRTSTIRDVARTASVSVASASRALNGHSGVTPSTRKSVLEAAAVLNYVPHLGARSLSTKRSNTIGVVLPDLFGEFFSEIIRGIDYAAHRRGLQLLLSNMHGSERETAAALRAMRGRVDGLLVMSPQLDADVLSHNLPRGLPAVIMNGWIDSGRYASIAIDNSAGAHAAVTHLVAQGCKVIAHLAGPEGNADAQERALGFRSAVAKTLGDRDPLIIRGDFSDEAGVAAGKLLAAQHSGVDGVFSANDVMAIGCMTALLEAGVCVPGDVAVVGFDDVPIARYVTPGLTTMRVHIAELGQRALDLLITTIETGDAPEVAAELLTPELVVRASSARTGDPTIKKARTFGNKGE